MSSIPPDLHHVLTMFLSLFLIDCSAQDDPSQFPHTTNYDENSTEFDEESPNLHMAPTNNQQSISTNHQTTTQMNSRAYRTAPSTSWQAPSMGESSRIEQEISKLKLKERKRKLEMMEEEHAAKMEVIKVEKL